MSLMKQEPRIKEPQIGMKVYVTKECLTKGIQVLTIDKIDGCWIWTKEPPYNYEGELGCLLKGLALPHQIRRGWYADGAFLSWDEALIDAEARKEQEIVHLGDQIARIKSLSFPRPSWIFVLDSRTDGKWHGFLGEYQRYATWDKLIEWCKQTGNDVHVRDESYVAMTVGVHSDQIVLH